ncbi:hypothetical protein MKX75_04860 [Paenibacillus sp. FSL R5-0341]|uniref:hypothetical protein n=1 Tax=Paenibacillus sp. FSL R5-0341 TaxID=2921636 RepID=UPI0030D1E779
MQFDAYEFGIKKVYQKNPLFKLQDLLKEGNIDIDPGELLNLFIYIKKEWESVKHFNVQGAIIISDSTTVTGDVSFRKNELIKDIQNVIQSAKKCIIYNLNTNGFIGHVELKNDKFTYEDLVIHSKEHHIISIYMGIKGIDIIINGIPFESENRMENYSDVINYRSLVDISNYKELLNRFFKERIQYDPFKSLFVYKNELPKSLHSLIEENPKLLKVKPEERFQKELEYFLKQNCLGKVLTEVKNKFGERYDVWISTSDDKLYVFEIKWLGKSLTAEGNIFKGYNDPVRVMEGAHQLKKYIDDAEGHSQALGGDFRIYCGVLITYDAREDMTEFDDFNEFTGYPQLDLKQHFKIEKDKIPASKYYKKVIQSKAK